MPPEAPSLATASHLTTTDAERLAREAFDVTCHATRLASERDQNFSVVADDERRFVLKIANAAERREMLEAENAVMHHLAATGLVPMPLPARQGGAIARHEEHFVRLITWIDGRTLGDTAWHSDALLARRSHVCVRASSKTRPARSVSGFSKFVAP